MSIVRESELLGVDARESLFLQSFTWQLGLGRSGFFFVSERGYPPAAVKTSGGIPDYHDGSHVYEIGIFLKVFQGG
jgi:hypothetical protein